MISWRSIHTIPVENHKESSFQNHSLLNITQVSSKRHVRLHRVGEPRKHPTHFSWSKFPSYIETIEYILQTILLPSLAVSSKHLIKTPSYSFLPKDCLNILKIQPAHGMASRPFLSTALAWGMMITSPDAYFIFSWSILTNLFSNNVASILHHLPKS